MQKCSACATAGACFLAQTSRHDLETKYFVLESPEDALDAGKVAWWRQALTHVYHAQAVACLSGAALHAAFAQPHLLPNREELLAALEAGLHGGVLTKAALPRLGCACCAERRFARGGRNERNHRSSRSVLSFGR